ncbi:MAG: M28 family peptidase [Bacteroidia bacterium]|nr:M28 family peptidase [Bacteroidia bacterium]
MRKYISFFIFLFVSSFSFAQNSVEDVEKVYAETISAHDLKAHIGFLADDLLEGRETGTRGQRLAAAYIKTHFQRIGLAPGNPDGTYFQYYYLNRSEIKSASISFGGKSYEYTKEFFNYRRGFPDSLAGELVFAGYGISNDEYDNLEGLDLEGKIAVVLGGSPNNEAEKEQSRIERVRSWATRQKAIEAKGAKAMIMILPSDMDKTIRRYARKRSFEISASSETGMPEIFMGSAMGSDLLKLAKGKLNKLQEALAENATPPKLKLDKVSDFSLSSDVDFTSTAASNVLGYLEGTDKKDEVVILTAHYDHIGISRNGEINNGADDDGSGTSAILELAEAFAMAAKNGNPPRRSMIFMTVSGEEKGLLGSRFYTDYPLYPLANTVANLNIDMIGRIDKKYEEREDSTNYVYIIGSDKLSTDLHNIGEEANTSHSGLTLDYTYNDENDPNRFYYRSDHYNFAKNNIPVIFYFTGVHVDYHKPGDDAHKIRYDKTAKITKLVYHTAWELANRQDRIVVDKAEEE